MDDITYRDFGWVDPKFKYGTTVKLIHGENDTTRDMRHFTVVNYWRGFNGRFGYHIVANWSDSSQPDEGENFEDELEAVE